MRYELGKTIIIALGGSIINPEKINAKLLKNFRSFIFKWVARGKKFIIVAGGGAPARDYQKAGNKIIKLSSEDKDWIGIHATRLNAHLLRTIFFREADPVVIDSRFKIRALKHKITIASGWRPGWSTDYIAIQLAEDFSMKNSAMHLGKIREVIIAGNISNVYTSDPNKNKKASAMESLTWKTYSKIIPTRWTPGLHAPVDPVGAKLAFKKKINAIIVDGRDLKNFDNLLAGKNFIGTIIQ